ncbi:MAG TPA: ABC transporter permease subunit [Spirochaetia bacterium]|nr:ABC transporter permease subunit [Spirochaetia bacterium]
MVYSRKVPSAPALKEPKKGFLFELRKNKILFLMLSPALLYFVLFFYIPFVGAYYAFVNYNYALGLFRSPFVGFANFRFLFVSNVIVRLTVNTLLYNVAFIAFGNFFQIMIAILISRITSPLYRRVTQTMIFLPYFISFVLVGLFAYGFLNYDYGMIDAFLKRVGIERISFYTAPQYWKFILPAAYVWKWLGYGSVIYLASIMSINGELYDAASIDGAGVFRQIWAVTLPMLKPTVIILLLFSIGTILRGQFELFYQIIGRNGLLYNATDIIDTYVYRSLIVSAQLSLGTAAGLYQSVFGLVVILAANFAIKKFDPEYALF